ncbi:hypothetical protein, partial [Methylobacter sp.]|uniref:hypothetical protein n=1 Tax=Methylobacter sp. TaxID=2051955 RepID=UPI002487D1F1
TVLYGSENKRLHVFIYTLFMFLYYFLVETSLFVVELTLAAPLRINLGKKPHIQSIRAPVD